jgi:hypothetical protein
VLRAMDTFSSPGAKKREKQASPAFLDLQILHLVFSLNTPNTASEVRACDQFTSIPNENTEQSLLGRPEFDLAPHQAHLVGSEVHADTSLHQKGAVCYTRRGTPKDAEPGQEFRTAEWLCHKIVRAGIKRCDLVRLPVAARREPITAPSGHPAINRWTRQASGCAFRPLNL